MKRVKLTAEEIASALAELPGWSLQNGKLRKQFQFGSFAEAIGWMVSVSIHADRMDHHPDWSNVYNRVLVDLWTHDLQAVSSWDIHLAQIMESLAHSE